MKHGCLQRLWSGEAGGNGPESNTLLSPGVRLSQIWIATWWVCVWRARAGCYLGKGGIYLSGQHKIPICTTSYLLELVAKAMMVHLPLMHTQLKKLGWAGPTSKIADSSPVGCRCCLNREAGCGLLLTHPCTSHRELARWFHLKKSEVQSHLLSCPDDRELDFLSTSLNWISQRAGICVCAQVRNHWAWWGQEDWKQLYHSSFFWAEVSSMCCGNLSVVRQMPAKQLLVRGKHQLGRLQSAGWLCLPAAQGTAEGALASLSGICPHRFSGMRESCSGNELDAPEDAHASRCSWLSWWRNDAASHMQAFRARIREKLHGGQLLLNVNWKDL